MEVNFALTATDTYQKAKEALERKDLVNFMENIGSALALAQNDKALLGDVLFTKVKGFIHFNQHRLALNTVPVALAFNDGVKAFRLKKYKGVAFGYLGEFEKAVTIFKELSESTDDQDLLVEVHTNLIWAFLLMYRVNKDDTYFSEVPIYLELINQRFDHINNSKKVNYLMNYSTYQYYLGDCDKAISILENALQYCSEESSLEVYNNLATLHLAADSEGVANCVHQYTDKVEILGEKYANYLEMGKAFLTKAEAELREDQLFTALDTMYLSLEYFKKAEAYPLAFDCLIRINEIVNDYKVDRLHSLKEDMKNKFMDTPYYNQI